MHHQLNSDLVDELLDRSLKSSSKKIINVNATNESLQLSVNDLLNRPIERQNFLSYHASKDQLLMQSFGNLRQSEQNELEQ